MPSLSRSLSSVLSSQPSPSPSMCESAMAELLIQESSQSEKPSLSSSRSSKSSWQPSESQSFRGVEVHPSIPVGQLSSESKTPSLSLS